MTGFFFSISQPIPKEGLRLREFVKRFVRHVVAMPSLSSSSNGAAATFKALLQLFLDQSLDDRLNDNIRFAILEKLLGDHRSTREETGNMDGNGR